MFRVAVCDDEQTVCWEIEKILLGYGKKTHTKIEVDVYESGERLCSALEEGEMYHLLFLDIMLIKLNGIDVCEKIRTEYENEELQIIYISSNQGFAMQLFEGRPLNFLVKPLHPDKVISNFKKACSLWQKNIAVFEFKSNHTNKWVKTKDIKYFESDNKKIIMHMVQGNVVFYGKLSEIAERLHDAEFLWVHKSYLVNYRFIKVVNFEQVELIGGISLPISKTFRVEVRDFVMKKREELLNE